MAVSHRKSRIVCTIGPASADLHVIESLIRGGMDVARLNFSHGDLAFHERAVMLIKRASRKLGRPVAIMQDLQGIKLRVGTFPGGSIELKKYGTTQLVCGAGQGDERRIAISYPRLLKDVRPGARILLDDGLLSLKVIGKEKNSLVARVTEGGTLRDRKGVNLPDTAISARSFTDKDRSDLEAGIRMGVDYVALSFVRKATEITKVRSYLKRKGLFLPLVAKIERPEAIENIEEIIEAADVIMVARGDLGVELPAEDVPVLQKQIIAKANRRGRPVITATQMLESMTEHSRPTRAEVADVANAVLDGSDALMLSAETSAGKYPIESLRMMDRIIRKAEASDTTHHAYRSGNSYSEATALAAREAACAVQARYIVAFTRSGYTARLTSSFRPPMPVLAFTPDEAVVRRMRMYWGVEPMLMKELKSTDAVFRELDRVLIRKRLARRGDSVVITLSTPVGRDGKTNMMKIHRVGEST